MTSPFLPAFQPPPPPDPEERGLLRDIRDQPDADTPYQIYADWLEDHGNAYAAVVRGERLPTVVETLARLGGAGSWLAHLGYPAVDLLVRPHYTGASDTADMIAFPRLPPTGPPPRCWLTIRRGFARIASWPRWLWWTAGPQLLHDQPVSRLDLTDTDPAVRLMAVILATARHPLLYYWQGAVHRPEATDPAYLVPLSWIQCSDPPERSADGWAGYSASHLALRDLSQAALRWAQGAAAAFTCRLGPFTPDRWGEFPGGPIFPAPRQSPGGGDE